jgi:hypothetical protein
MVEKHFAASPEQAREEMEWAVEEGILRQDKYSIGTYKSGLRIKGRVITKKISDHMFPEE